MPDERVPLFVRLGETESRQLASAVASTGKTKRQLVEEAVREHLSDDALLLGRIELRENRPEAITRTAPAEIMTLAEAATFLRLEEPVLESAAEAGELPAASIGGQWRFSKAALLQWLASPKPHPAAAP